MRGILLPTETVFGLTLKFMQLHLKGTCKVYLHSDLIKLSLLNLAYKGRCVSVLVSLRSSSPWRAGLCLPPSSLWSSLLNMCLDWNMQLQTMQRYQYWKLISRTWLTNSWKCPYLQTLCLESSVLFCFHCFFQSPSHQPRKRILT